MLDYVHIINFRIIIIIIINGMSLLIISVLCRTNVTCAVYSVQKSNFAHLFACKWAQILTQYISSN